MYTNLIKVYEIFFSPLFSDTDKQTRGWLLGTLHSPCTSCTVSSSAWPSPCVHLPILPHHPLYLEPSSLSSVPSQLLLILVISASTFFLQRSLSYIAPSPLHCFVHMWSSHFISMFYLINIYLHVKLWVHEGRDWVLLMIICWGYSIVVNTQ